MSQLIQDWLDAVRSRSGPLTREVARKEAERVDRLREMLRNATEPERLKTRIQEMKEAVIRRQASADALGREIEDLRREETATRRSACQAVLARCRRLLDLHQASVNRAVVEGADRLLRRELGESWPGLAALSPAEIEFVILRDGISQELGQALSQGLLSDWDEIGRSAGVLQRCEQLRTRRDGLLNQVEAARQALRSRHEVRETVIDSICSLGDPHRFLREFIERRKSDAEFEGGRFLPADILEEVRRDA